MKFAHQKFIETKEGKKSTFFEEARTRKGVDITLYKAVDYYSTSKNKEVTIYAVVDGSEKGRVEFNCFYYGNDGNNHTLCGIYLSRIDVDKSMKRKGIGSKLVEIILNEEPEFVYTVPKTGDGMKLMTNLGFSQASPRGSHYVLGDVEAYKNIVRFPTRNQDHPVGV